MRGPTTRDIVYGFPGAAKLGRPRIFNEITALDAAIDRFWQNGYEATSVRDLAQEMNIKGASLYNAFGDKRLLFRAALQRYLDREARLRLSILKSGKNPARGLKRFFRDLVASAGASDWGCLLVNSAMEIAPHDDVLAVDIRAGLSEIEDGLRDAIITGQNLGVISRHRSPIDGARLLLAAVIGILVLSRVRGDTAVMTGIARTALDAVFECRNVGKPRRPGRR